jgi:hypothetical protein
MPHLPLRYRVVGQDDYMLEIDVGADGCFVVDSGDYTSHEPRRGALTPGQGARLTGLLDRLGEPRDHPAPEGAEGFVAILTLGDGGQTRVFHFWEGALAEDPGLEAVVRALEVL